MTLQDIANQVGVSKRTVSRILNGQIQRHNAQTVRRVVEAAEAMNYSPNPLSRALAGGSSKSIGLILRGLGGQRSVKCIAAVAEEAQKAGYLNCIVTSNRRGDDSEHVVLAARQLVARRVDALLIHRSLPISPEARRQLRDLPVPVVYLGWGPPRDAHRIWVDHESAACQIATHLKALGHRCVAMFPSDHARDFPEHRINPFQRAMAALSMHLLLDKSWIINSSEESEISAYDVTRRFLATNDRATAIFIHNDMAAAGVLAALHDAGLKIPDDISVVSYDDLALARVLRPRLTTVRLPDVELATRAFQMIRTLIEQPEGPMQSQRIDLELIVRESTGPAPACPPQVALDAPTGRSCDARSKDEVGFIASSTDRGAGNEIL